MGPFVDILQGLDAQVRKVVADSLEIFFRQNFFFVAIGTPGHDRPILSFSLFVRHSGLSRNIPARKTSGPPDCSQFHSWGSADVFFWTIIYR